MAVNTLLILMVITLLIILSFFVGKLVGTILSNRKWEQQIPDLRGDAIKRSRASLSGQINEQLAPFLPNFPYKASEARFIGKPIDFIIFKGMDEKNIKEIVFLEIKSGSSTLTTHERKLRDTIKQGKVKWEQCTISEKT